MQYPLHNTWKIQFLLYTSVGPVEISNNRYITKILEWRVRFFQTSADAFFVIGLTKYSIPCSS